MKEKNSFYLYFLKAFLLEAEDFSDKLWDEYEQQIFSLTPKDNSWGLNQKQIRATVFLHLCLSRKRLALSGHTHYIAEQQSMAGIGCLFETTREQGIFDEVLNGADLELKKEIARYLNPDHH